MATIRKAFAWFKSFKNRVKKFCYRTSKFLKKRRRNTVSAANASAPQDLSESTIDSTVNNSSDNTSVAAKVDEPIASKNSIDSSVGKPLCSDMDIKLSESGGQNKPPRHNKEKRQRMPKQEDFENFYKKWDRFHGPTLTYMDRKFLESLDEEFFELEQNAWQILASPYLKAVYNGLESIRKIDDLLILDQKAKDRIKPFILNCIEDRPETVDRVIGLIHNKVSFETRYGQKRLSLDPRILPLWLGLSA